MLCYAKNIFDQYFCFLFVGLSKLYVHTQSKDIYYCASFKYIVINTCNGSYSLIVFFKIIKITLISQQPTCYTRCHQSIFRQNSTTLAAYNSSWRSPKYDYILIQLFFILLYAYMPYSAICIFILFVL